MTHREAAEKDLKDAKRMWNRFNTMRRGRNQDRALMAMQVSALMAVAEALLALREDK